MPPEVGGNFLGPAGCDPVLGEILTSVFVRSKHTSMLKAWKNHSGGVLFIYLLLVLAKMTVSRFGSSRTFCQLKDRERGSSWRESCSWPGIPQCWNMMWFPESHPKVQKVLVFIKGVFAVFFYMVSICYFEFNYQRCCQSWVVYCIIYCIYKLVQKAQVNYTSNLL